MIARPRHHGPWGVEWSDQEQLVCAQAYSLGTVIFTKKVLAMLLLIQTHSFGFNYLIYFMMYYLLVIMPLYFLQHNYHW